MINICEILKNAPIGVSLYSKISGEVILSKVVDNSIVVKSSKSDKLYTYDSEGRLKGFESEECILFPKDNIEWAEWPIYLIKNGDFVVLDEKSSDKYTRIGICQGVFPKDKSEFKCKMYFSIPYDEKEEVDSSNYFWISCDNIRFATDKEIQIFLKKLKDRGVCWNDKTCELEKVDTLDFFLISKGKYYKCIKENNVFEDSLYKVDGIYSSTCDNIIIDDNGKEFNWKNQLYAEYFCPWYPWKITDAVDGDPVIINDKFFLFKKLENSNITAYFGFDEKGVFNDTEFTICNYTNDMIQKADCEDIKKFIEEIKLLGYKWRFDNDVYLIPDNQLTIDKNKNYICIKDFENLFKKGMIYHAPKYDYLKGERNLIKEFSSDPLFKKFYPNVSEYFKLWTIEEDAKSGDILKADDVLFIYSGELDKSNNPITIGYADLNGVYKEGQIKLWRPGYVLRIPTESEKAWFESIKKEEPTEEEKPFTTETKSKEKDDTVIDFKPFDKVLVRNFGQQVWTGDFFINYVSNKFSCVGGVWKYCIPYNEKTEKLLGTSVLPEEGEI